MKIIVTGSQGVIGSYFRSALVNESISAIYTEFDLSNEANYLPLTSENYIVVHIAGEKRKQIPELIRNNIIATANLLKHLCLEEEFRGLIYISSIAVFGSQTNITESSRLEPDTYYGFSKLICEKLIKQTLKDKPYTIIRPTNVVLPDESSIVGKIVQMITKGDAFEAWKSSLNVRRDYVWIGDVVDLLVSCLKDMICESYNKQLELNLGEGVAYTLDEVISIVEKETKRQLKRNITNNSEYRSRDISVVISPIVRQLIGRELTSLSDSVRKTAAMYDLISKNIKK